MSTGELRGFPLSAQQRRLWLLHRQGLPCAARCAVRLEGALEPDRLRDAFEGVVARHEILRTGFPRRPGLRVPVQGISDSFQPAWIMADLRILDAAEREAELGRRWREDGLALTDLERAVPILNLELLHLEPEVWELLITLPALCADGPTLDRLVSEAARLYGGVSEGEEPLQFLDYADWQNELLEVAAADPAAAGERERRRAELLSRLDVALPLARRDAAPAWRGERIPVPVDPGLLAGLGFTVAELGTWLLAGQAALAARLADRSDLAVGLVLDGRRMVDVQGTFGPLARCLPTRLTVARDLPFAELLKRVRAAEDEAVSLLEELTWDDLYRDTGGAARCTLGFELAELPELQTAAGVTFRMTRRRAPVDSFVAQLACLRSGAVIDLALCADFGVLRFAEAGLLARQLAALLRDAAARPDVGVGALSLLNETERRRVVVEINATPGSGGTELVHRSFQAQARRTPEAVAVVCEDREVTYAQLAARATRLAAKLRLLGVGPEVPVGLFLERSVEMVAGLLGVLEAGGCYVPLDPFLPEPRLTAIAEAARPAVVVTEPGLAGGLSWFDGTVLSLPVEDEEGSELPAFGLESGVGLANAAYVLFTSGSTGRPKGVVVEHRQLSGYVTAVLERLGLPAGTSFATVSTLAADLGNTSIFPALCTGGPLHVLTQLQVGDATELAAQVARHSYDVLKIVPSHLSALLAASPEGSVLPRRCLVLGGEAFGWELAGKLRALAPDLVVFNHYGPTEATVGAAAGLLKERDELSATVPLGRPLANSRIYLLGTDGEPVPRCVPGEAFIGGGGVARGYLEDPRQTAERFVPDPFGGPGRLYATGDLARWLSDGRLEFLGRIDDQVKIRGFRVEPAEITAVLRAHPGVRDATVVVRTELSGERRLVAYLVEKPGRSVVAELREWLRQRLPEHMVPAALVPMAVLPLTANGKLDRRALPAPEAGRLAVEVPYVVPRTAAEQIVAAIWRELLGIERVGLHDNFFDLGGHSLHMVQVQSRVRDQFQRQVTIVDLFRHPTVRGLADFLSEEQVAGRVGSAGEETARTEARKAALDQVRPSGVLQVDHG